MLHQKRVVSQFEAHAKLLLTHPDSYWDAKDAKKKICSAACNTKLRHYAKNGMKSRIRILCLYVFCNSLWLGSVSVHAQLPPASFYHLKRDKELFSSTFHTIAEDRYGFIWFGSQAGGGLYRYDGNELKAFVTDPGNLQGSIATTRINKVYTEIDSLICIGTSFGFSLLNPVTGAIRNFNNYIEYVPDVRMGMTYAFCLDSLRKVLWVGTRYGLASLDLKGSWALNILNHEGPDDEVIPEIISDILMDPADSDLLWFGTNIGLFSYSIGEQRYRHHNVPGLENEQVVIYDLFQEKTGGLWITTLDGKLITYTPTTNVWSVFSIDINGKNSAQSNRRDIYGVLPEDGTVWLATHTTVGRYDLELDRYEAWSYDAALPDGLLISEVYRDFINDRHGRMWIASWHGVQYAKQAFLPPSHIVDSLRVVIVGVDAPPVFETTSLLMYTGRLELRKEQRDVTFRYVLPNPLDISRVEYQYKLVGFDKDWITTDQRAVRYTRLKGGTYTFLVRAREGDTSWLPVTELQVQIPRRVFEYFWFWIIVIIILGTIAILIYQLLISNVRKQERIKAEFDNKLSEIQMQALRAQMNPHFLFNSLNSIKYYAISKSKDETATYLSKFAMLVRAILNNSQSRTISLKDELDALQLYIEIEHLRLEGKFDYLVDIDSSIHVQQAQIPPMILQPYVENAIWHGLMHKVGGGRLFVQVRDMGNQIQCIIEDNGIGRVRAAEMRSKHMDHKKSVGMQITSDRITLINKIYHIDTQVHVIDLADTEGNPSGTRVVINIPLIRDEDE